MTEKRTFQRGDHTELADALIEELTRLGVKKKLPGAPFYREVDPATHNGRRFRFVEDPELSRIVQSFAGSTVVGDRPLRIQYGTVRAVIQLARAR